MSGPGPDDPARWLAGQIVALLAERRQTVAVAESLTGGLLGAALTAIPGASAVFRGGVIAYATELKAALLGVPADLLAARGAVDPEVAAAMAEGVRQRLEATAGVATTGVAGPDPADGKMPGTVHVAVAAGGPAVTRALTLTGDRDEVRRVTVVEALQLLLDILREHTGMITALRLKRTRSLALSPFDGGARYRGFGEPASRRERDYGPASSLAR